MGGSFSGISVTSDSVVRIILAILEAFSSAVLVTLRGSIMPFSTILPYSSLEAS